LHRLPIRLQMRAHLRSDTARKFRSNATAVELVCQIVEPVIETLRKRITVVILVYLALILLQEVVLVDKSFDVG